MGGAYLQLQFHAHTCTDNATYESSQYGPEINRELQSADSIKRGIRHGILSDFLCSHSGWTSCTIRSTRLRPGGDRTLLTSRLSSDSGLLCLDHLGANHTLCVLHIGVWALAVCMFGFQSHIDAACLVSDLLLQVPEAENSSHGENYGGELAPGREAPHGA